MKHLLLTTAFIAAFSVAKAQKADTAKQLWSDTLIYTAVEQEPEFPGGMGAFFKFLGENISIIKEKDQNFQATFLFEMIIEKDGSFSNVKELRRIPNSATGKGIIKLLQASPKWKPGMQNGRPVRVLYKFPLTF